MKPELRHKELKAVAKRTCRKRINYLGLGVNHCVTLYIRFCESTFINQFHIAVQEQVRAILEKLYKMGLGS